jgi:hypothetical protein
MKKICAYLQLEYSEQMIESFQSINLEGMWGDQFGIKKYNSLSKNSLHNWQKTFNNPIRRYWAIKYLDWLGEENLGTMGYSYRDLRALVSNRENMNLNGLFSDLIRSVFYLPANFILTQRENNTTPPKYPYY